MFDQIADAARLEAEPLGGCAHGQEARRTDSRARRPAPTAGHPDEPGRRPALDRYLSEEILGESPAMIELRDLITKVAASEATTVLIEGESGTGKELVARALHYRSERADNPLVEVNCSQFQEALLNNVVVGIAITRERRVQRCNRRFEEVYGYDPGSADIARKFDAATKYVATHRPESLGWQNSRGLGDDVVGAVRALKQQDGPTLLTQGSTTLIHQLLAAGQTGLSIAYLAYYVAISLWLTVRGR